MQFGDAFASFEGGRRGCTCTGKELQEAGEAPLEISEVHIGWPAPEYPDEEPGINKLVCGCEGDLGYLSTDLDSEKGRGEIAIRGRDGCKCSIRGDKEIGTGTTSVEFQLPAVNRNQVMDFFRDDRRINELSADDRAEIFHGALPYIPDDFVDQVNEILSDYGADYGVRKAEEPVE
jgi:hypothetical protein